MRTTACAFCVCSIVVALAPLLAADEQADAPKQREVGVYQRYAPKHRIEKVAVEVSLDETPPSMRKGGTLEASVFRSFRSTIPVGKRVLRVSLTYIDGKASASRKCHQVTLYADEKPLKAKSAIWTKMEAAMKDDSMVEAEFPLDTLERLGGANAIRGEICKDVFRLAPDAAKLFAALASEAEKPPVLEEQ